MADVDASAVADLLAIKDRVHAIVEAIVPELTDSFVVEVQTPGMELPYVQGMLQGDNRLQLELCHETFLGRQLTESQREACCNLGWLQPQEHLPNYWQLVRVDELGASEIASLCVNSLDYIYNVFSALPADATISIRPLELALRVVPDAESIAQYQLPGETEWQSAGLPRPDERYMHLVPSSALIAWLDELEVTIRQWQMLSLHTVDEHDLLRSGILLINAATMHCRMLGRYVGRPAVKDTTLEFAEVERILQRLGTNVIPALSVMHPSPELLLDPVFDLAEAIVKLGQWYKSDAGLVWQKLVREMIREIPSGVDWAAKRYANLRGVFEILMAVPKPPFEVFFPNG